MKINISGMPPVDLPDDYLERITLRMLQDALAQATAGYWLRRAEQIETAYVRPGDYKGGATTEQVLARHKRTALAAEQCRIHATLSTHDDIDADLIAEVLGFELVADVEELAA